MAAAGTTILLWSDTDCKSALRLRTARGRNWGCALASVFCKSVLAHSPKNLKRLLVENRNKGWTLLISENFVDRLESHIYYCDNGIE